MGTLQCRLEHCHPCSGSGDIQLEKCRVDQGKEGIEGTLLDGGRTYFDYGIVLTTIISTKGKVSKERFPIKKCFLSGFAQIGGWEASARNF